MASAEDLRMVADRLGATAECCRPSLNASHQTRFALLPRAAIRAADLMAAQPAKIEQGSGASMLEAIFNVQSQRRFQSRGRPMP